MGPTSASPPPMYGNKLSLPPNPLYENRDHIAPTEPGLEDNIYEMLPENIVRRFDIMLYWHITWFINPTEYLVH